MDGQKGVELSGMKGVKRKIMVMSGKGGVGKSTVAASLAVALRALGKSVGILDADIHGPSVPKIIGAENVRLEVVDNKIVPAVVHDGIRVISMAYLLSESDSPVIWRGPIKMKAISQFLNDVDWGELDYLIVDLPPGTGDEPLSIAQLLPNNDGAIIVTTPQEVSLLSVRKAVNFARVLKVPIIGVIENMSGFVCPNCGTRIEIFGSGGGEKIAKEYDLRLLGKIPIDPRIVEAGDSGKALMVENESDDIASIFLKIAREVDSIVSGGGDKE
ncbi:MAG: ATP-binding protein [Thermoplasmata archaeon]|nr:MAG: ATP-binding protein [Thermoplasmata archaeon]